MLQSLIKRYLNSVYFAMRAERNAALKQAMERDQKAWLLDCGCREGNASLELARRVETTHILGLDLNSRLLQEAAQRGIIPVETDLNGPIPLKGSSFDVIVATNILEHLVDPYVFVGELYRVLRPGGYLVLDTPNLASWHNVFALLLGIQPFSGPNITTMQDVEIGLVRDIHRDHGLAEQTEYADRAERAVTRHIVVVAYAALLKLLKGHGFSIERALGFGYYPFPPLVARMLQRLDPRHAHHLLVKARKPAQQK